MTREFDKKIHLDLDFNELLYNLYSKRTEERHPNSDGVKLYCTVANHFSVRVSEYLDALYNENNAGMSVSTLEI